MAKDKKVTAVSDKVKVAPKKVSAEKVAVKKDVLKDTQVNAEKPTKVSGKAKTAAGKHQKVRKVLSGSVVKVQQVASGAGRLKSQIQTLKGLNLNKINKVSELEDTPSIRGMINKVKHLIKVLSK